MAEGGERTLDSLPNPLSRTTLREGDLQVATHPDVPARQYLFVLEHESSSMFQLPASGEVVIGRADNVDLRLQDASVSRQHARVVLAGGEAHVVDLGSQNGTWVNGERIVDGRPLVSGDWIRIGDATLVFHSSARRSGTRSILELRGLQRRTEEELERALRHDRPLALAAIEVEGIGDRSSIARAIAVQLRLTDIIAWGAADELLVLMPETATAGVENALGRLSVVVGLHGAHARIGYSICPTDGCDAPALIAAARLAAREAAPGAVVAAGQTYLVREVGERRVIIADAAMIRLYALIERLAAADLPVLVCGETGTGKDLVAAAIHHWSPRATRPLVTLNCAALPETLVESELFGHERGAFSGAVAAKPGLLETATGGTVLLDEIGDLAPATQAKLLRVLETKRVTRLGDVREREIDIRIVAATNRDLQADAKAGRFRQDLFFRLSGATLWLPPLRDRRRELPILAQAFLREACTRAARESMTLSDAALRALFAHAWPGNVRELKYVMDYVAAAHPERTVEAWHLAERIGEAPAARPATEQPPAESEPQEPSAPEPGAAAAPPGEFRPIDEEVRDLERRRMAEALAASGGNQTRAARLISMPLRTFQAKVKQYGLRDPPK